MREEKDFVNGEDSVGKKGKGKGKEGKEISFGVREWEYLKLEECGESLNMSVGGLVKKKGEGSGLVGGKFDKERGEWIGKDLSKLGGNVNEMGKQCKEDEDERGNYEKLEGNMYEVGRKVDEIWERVN